MPQIIAIVAFYAIPSLSAFRIWRFRIKAVSAGPAIFKFIAGFNVWPLFLKNISLRLIVILKQKKNIIQVRYF